MVLKKEISLQIKDLLQKNPQGLNITDIVKEVKINRNTAGRYLENLLVSGQVDMRRFGMAKIYMISQRVPLSAVLSVSSERKTRLQQLIARHLTKSSSLRRSGRMKGRGMQSMLQAKPIRCHIQLHSDVPF